jgi:hypothetical protein
MPEKRLTEEGCEGDSLGMLHTGLASIEEVLPSRAESRGGLRR